MLSLPLPKRRAPQNRYNLRKREPINYDDTKRYKARVLYQNGLVLEDNRKILEENLNKDNHKTKDMFKRCLGICINKMTAKADIKKHGEAAITAILKEFGQLNDKGTFKPVFKHTLTKDQIS